MSMVPIIQVAILTRNSTVLTELDRGSKSVTYPWFLMEMDPSTDLEPGWNRIFF